MTEPIIFCKFDIFDRLTGEGKPRTGRAAALRAATIIVACIITFATAPVAQSRAASPSDFTIELLTPSIEAEISAQPGTYPVEDPLHLLVTSPDPGWRMVLHSFVLKDHDLNIDPDEVYLRNDDDTTVNLSKPREVVTYGQAGQTMVEVELVLKTDTFHEGEVYTGYLLVVTKKPHGPWSPMLKVPFTVTITPFAHISVSADSLDLGTVPRPGVFDSPAKLIVHVAANIPHNGVMILMADPLEGPGGVKIPLNRTWVKLPAGGQLVDLTDQVAVTGPMNPGVFDVPLKFRVETDFGNPPGTYSGTLVVTLGVTL